MYNLFRFIIYLVYLQKLKDLGKITVLQRSDKRRVLYFKDTSADVEYNVDEGIYIMSTWTVTPEAYLADSPTH